MHLLLRRAPHEIARQCYLVWLNWFFFPLTRKLLGLKNVRLELRNSILEPEYFHFLFSDIDLALITAGPVDPSPKDAVQRLHRLRPLLIPMGEIEVYSDAEWENLKHLKSQSLLYRKWRSLRKLGWLKTAKASGLGKMKDLRARRVASTRLGMPNMGSASNIQRLKWASQQIEALFGPQGASTNHYFHPYWGLQISPNEFSPSEIANLALSAPLPFTQVQHMMDLITKGSPEVKAELWCLYQIEFFEVLGHQRGQLKPVPWAANYLDDLAKAARSLGLGELQQKAPLTN